MLEILRTRNQPQEESGVFLEVEHLLRQLDVQEANCVSHSFTESEIVSLDAGLRATLHSKTKAQKVKRRQKVDPSSDVDHVPTNTHSSQNVSQLYIFEDSEAVFKMVIKGRRPATRRVSRTHRVALDWLFDTIKFGTRNPNQICCPQKPTR